MRAVVVLLMVCASLVEADIYTVMKEGDVKCYFEDVPQVRGRREKKKFCRPHILVTQNTLVVAAFSCIVQQDTGAERTAGSGLLIEASDPSENVVVAKTTDMIGRFAFTAPVGGEYALCFKTNTSSWFGAHATFKFYIDISVGSKAQDYDKIAKLEHLNKVDVKIRQLSDQIAEVRAEQKYLRELEGAWRALSEHVHASIIWWSLGQLVILLASGVFQMRYLKNFFKTKKLV